MPPIKNRAGQKYGRLTFLSFAGISSTHHALWLCRCDCGNENTFKGSDVVSGNTKSCGCLIKDVLRNNYTTHGATVGGKTRLYRIYQAIHTRCSNPNYKDWQYYGGKGVKVCDEWRTFDKFQSWSLAHGYSCGLSIDRIDPRGDYSPDNCRWITTKMNSSRATRGERNGSAKLNYFKVEVVRFMLANVKITKTKLAKLFGVSRQTISAIADGSHWKQPTVIAQGELPCWIVTP